MIMQLCLFIIYHQQQRWAWKYKAVELLFGSYIFDRCDVKSTYFVCFCFQAVSLFWIEAPSRRKCHWYVVKSVVYIIVSVGIRTIFSELYANYINLFDYLPINYNYLFDGINMFYSLMPFKLYCNIGRYIHL